MITTYPAQATLLCVKSFDTVGGSGTRADECVWADVGGIDPTKLPLIQRYKDDRRFERSIWDNRSIGMTGASGMTGDF